MLGFDTEGVGEGEAYTGPSTPSPQKQNFFDQVPTLSSTDPRRTWPYSGYTLPEIQSLSVIGLSGLASELIFTSRISSGSRNDLYTLNRIMEQSQEPLNELDRERIITQALVFCVTEIKRREGGIQMIYESLKNDKEYFEIDEARVEEKWDEGYIIPKDSKSGLKGLENFTGDDPLYIAIGVAGAFAAWASTGGLTLH
ncbi:hypothetical protein TrST_g10956 [Triparma strigata]|nr:hypothetical protein TrST_g10956 [Triparma strigata]